MKTNFTNHSASTLALMILFMITAQRESLAGWERVRAVKNVTVETISLQDSELKKIKGIVTIKQPLEKVVAVFDKYKTLKKWLHRLIEVKKLAGDDENFTLYFRFDMPIGVADRDVAARFKRTGYGTNLVTYEGYLLSDGAGQKGAVAMTRFHTKWRFERKGVDTLITYTQYSNPGGLLPAVLVMPVAIDMVLNSLIDFKRLLEGIKS